MPIENFNYNNYISYVIDSDVDKLTGTAIWRVHIMNIFIPKKERRKGFATKAVKAFLAYLKAEFTHYSVRLSVQPNSRESAIKTSELISWYKSFGFIETQDITSKCIAGTVSMKLVNL